jgi:hypothetical protein
LVEVLLAGGRGEDVNFIGVGIARFTSSQVSRMVLADWYVKILSRSSLF